MDAITLPQEEEAAEVNALANEAHVPLEQLLAQYGFKIGPDGIRQRIVDELVAVEGMEPLSEGAATTGLCLTAGNATRISSADWDC